MRNGADLNGDNLGIYRVYLRISDHCRVTVRVRVWVRVRNMVRVGVSIRVSVSVGVADCCIQTAGKSNKMRISHVIKTDQWRSAPQIRLASHFVVFPFIQQLLINLFYLFIYLFVYFIYLIRQMAAYSKIPAHRLS